MVLNIRAGAVRVRAVAAGPARYRQAGATLDDDQLALALPLFERAAEINHKETVRLRDARVHTRGRR